jgi:hypothetical protein
MKLKRSDGENSQGYPSIRARRDQREAIRGSGALILDSQGRLKRAFPVPVCETHCITVSSCGGQETLWIADTGGKGRDHGGPQVVHVDLEGRVLARIAKADTGYGAAENFCCTAVAVDPQSGEVWIADGYGSSRVLCFSRELKLQRVFDGSDGLGRFACPHWVRVDRRKGVSEIYIADRSNDRIQVYGADGKFLRGIRSGLVTPSGFAGFGDYLVVAELKARLVLLDREDRIVGYIGAGPHHVVKPGWPNRHDAAGKGQPPQRDIRIGEFNSPHGVCADAQGSIYVSEWLLGDRFTKLERVA